ncbi:helix-turn-helix transcriptional regulator [Sphingomonas ginsenosidivorax]|uniref:Helix-turn-helix transcriptional regulator n=1 Tax=Sphingomonas ginsenosidivorax TaxID=862135 RepID=A0A5C6UFY6_9SPHN|nr:helix-turn-helix transcriptional regulator [Sphingomonas ginsenosidivorax]TXC71667.1 helix-turn-helix transcriptional regulator [Sphingomonas ginsenosidivorax]
MTGGRIDQLTEAQRACLRLVLSHHNSKEIAAIVGVSPSAIDKRIERAIQILGVGSRFEAARRLQEHEGLSAPAAGQAFGSAAGPTPEPAPDTTYERLPSEPIDVPNPPSEPADVRASEPWGLGHRFFGTLPTDGFEGVARNRSSKGTRLVRLIGLTVMIAIASMAIVNMAMTLTSLLRSSRTAAAPFNSAASAVPNGGTQTMLKERRRATDAVTADFLKAEAAVDEAAQLAATCVSTLLQQRVAANLPVSTGTAALQLVAEASMDIIKARQRFVDAHRALIEVRHDIGLGQFYGYGDVSECPPNEGALREAPRLSAVA